MTLAISNPPAPQVIAAGTESIKLLVGILLAGKKNNRRADKFIALPNNRG